MKLKIDQIDFKPIEWTDKKTGETKQGIKVGVKSRDTWYSCFKAPWNEGWAQGDEIDVEVKQNGKYWNIKPLQSAANSAAMDNVLKLLTELKQQNEQILSKLSGDNDSIF